MGRRIVDLVIIFLSIHCLEAQSHSSLYASSDPGLHSPGSDFSQHPGHLKQFASQSPRIKVAETNGFMETPQSFYKRYVTSKKPSVFKKIDQEFFGNTKFLPKLNNLKESGRTYMSYLTTLDGSSMSLHDYLAMIEDQSTPPVSSFIPEAIKSEIELPSIFKDSNIIDRLSYTTYIISNSTRAFPLKETKTNILYCQIEGSKEVLLIDKANDFSNYDTFLKRILEKHEKSPGDMIDYAKVDYKEFPELLEVQKYYIAKLEAGSCLFIPSSWIFQVTSLEFDHSFAIHFDDMNEDYEARAEEDSRLPGVMTLYDCPWPEEDITERPPVKSMDVTRLSMEKLIHVIDKYIINSDEEQMDGESFLEAIRKDKVLVEYALPEMTEEFRVEVRDIFEKMDINRDGKLSSLDFLNVEMESLDKIRRKVFFLLTNISEISYDLKIDNLGPFEGQKGQMDIKLLIQGEEVYNKGKYLEWIQDGSTRVNSKDEL